MHIYNITVACQAIPAITHWHFEVVQVFEAPWKTWADLIVKCFHGISSVQVVLSQPDKMKRWLLGWLAPSKLLIDGISVWQALAATSPSCYSPVCINWKGKVAGQGTFPEGPKTLQRTKSQSSWEKNKKCHAYKTQDDWFFLVITWHVPRCDTVKASPWSWHAFHGPFHGGFGNTFAI